MYTFAVKHFFSETQLQMCWQNRNNWAIPDIRLFRKMGEVFRVVLAYKAAFFSSIQSCNNFYKPIHEALSNACTDIGNLEQKLKQTNKPNYQ